MQAILNLFDILYGCISSLCVYNANIEQSKLSNRLCHEIQLRITVESIRLPKEFLPALDSCISSPSDTLLLKGIPIKPREKRKRKNVDSNDIQFIGRIVLSPGYGHISPVTTAGRIFTMVYAIFGIPIFLILLADFGKLFTRVIKFLWVRWHNYQVRLGTIPSRLTFQLSFQIFVRRLYYTGSCRKVRKTVPAQVRISGKDW